MKNNQRERREGKGRVMTGKGGKEQGGEGTKEN